MAHQALLCERRIGAEQRADEVRERLVLRSLVGTLVRALKLDADREIIAGGPARKLRLPGVPSACAETRCCAIVAK